jgi:type II secretory pathway pseudopilin PulG
MMFKPRKSSTKLIGNQQGFTYIIAMLLVVFVGISLMMIGQQWSVTMKRDREAELLFRGNRIQKAIELYAADFEGGQKTGRSSRYPLKLKELTKKNPKRYLQVVYKDPFTGEDFELIKDGKGGILGVRSKSMEKPFDQVNFNGADTYHAIAFKAVEGSTACRPGALNYPLCLQPTQSQPNQEGGSPNTKTSSPSPDEP